MQRILQESSGTSEDYIKTAETSNHPKGLAVDVLLFKDGKQLTFQSPIGTWGPASNALTTEIAADALANRNLLQETMVQAGFEIYEHEWWHFDFPGQEEASDERFEGMPGTECDPGLKETFLKEPVRK